MVAAVGADTGDKRADHLSWVGELDATIDKEWTAFMGGHGDPGAAGSGQKYGHGLDPLLRDHDRPAAVGAARLLFPLSS
ncbi:MAG: hypothetical protein EPN20_07575 [Magnetospirillum sp.]|nr:MAG: hypothetical protein EPN20_07575 [Magnetospirillum sp.]